MIIRNAKIVFSKRIWSDLQGSSGRKTGQANPEIYSENMCRSFSWGHSVFKTIVLFLGPILFSISQDEILSLDVIEWKESARNWC